MVSFDNQTQLIPLGEACDPFRFFDLLPNKKARVLLESARAEGVSGRLSFIATNPFEIVSIAAGSSAKADSWKKIKRYLKQYSAKGGGAYPFEGGLIGYFSYECKDWAEKTLSTRTSHKDLPPLAHLSLFDHVVVVDHAKNETILVISGLKRLSKKRIEELCRFYQKIYHQAFHLRDQAKIKKNSLSSRAIQSSFSFEEFRQAVIRVKEYIQKGDVFQVNLAQRLSFPVKESAGALYQKLRALNPSSFFGLYDTGEFQILSGSPERLLKLDQGLLETRPIAGTKARGKNESEDKKIAQELFLNPKERAEHIMLVDLERNDMGRVAKFGSVEVDELMVLENYSHVKHIVSNVRAVLRDNLDAVDALKAFFPGGTITGAPKIRAMQIIDELEPVRRGPYTGSLGYLSFSGNMDMNILIRSLVIRKGQASLHVGAGIVGSR